MRRGARRRLADEREGPTLGAHTAHILENTCGVLFGRISYILCRSLLRGRRPCIGMSSSACPRDFYSRTRSALLRRLHCSLSHRLALLEPVCPCL